MIVRHHVEEPLTVEVEPYPWEPRARCYVCEKVENRGNRRSSCDRCGGSGYVGEKRPRTVMVAIDIAWSDTGHVRLIGPNTPRRKGEGLYVLHACDSVIMPAPTGYRQREAVAA